MLPVKGVSQSLLLALLGGALLKISAFSADFANYVKPGFRPLLVAAGAVLVILAAATLAQDRSRNIRAARQSELARTRSAEEAHLAQLIGREPAYPAQDHDSSGHEHKERNWVAWLLMAPAAAIFLIAPPALGSYAVRQAEQVSHLPPPAVVDAFTTPLKSGGVNVLSMGEFAGRAWDDPRSLAGRTVRLTGFVVPSARENEWYLARMRINCCAADALTMKVAVKGAPAPKTDTWVRVTGTWIPPKERREDTYVLPEMAASRVDPMTSPAEPYE
ncbi:TIGR03943 family putative permease subunit [Nonomuraea sp. NPDC050153]|uniref:TIGR03943 family putative permease subunit n=1 Tax=Nonomuraea sp. NPDC050153 TaxID=3364359 RepID=UPI0037A49850